MSAGAQAIQIPATAPPAGSSILTVGFGITVAMWGVGYVGRLPAVLLPSPILLGLLLAALVGGGLFLGRHTGQGWRSGAIAGAISGSLNLLVLGSFLTSNPTGQLVPSALWWVPSSILVSAALAGGGAEAGARLLVKAEGPIGNWPGWFVRVAVAATLFLLAVGGLVTSTDSGLAVVDWPNSFGYNMFLYPFSRMTGGIYYEHAHRLFGALVGLTTVILAIHLQIVESRSWVKRIGWVAVVMVIAQGILGGLRVTGEFTLSSSATETSPNLALALVHGVFGQVFLATLVSLAVFTSATWKSSRPPLERPSAGTDRILGVILIAFIVGQLMLGATLRHFDKLLMVHIVTGIALVTPLVIHSGMRAWGLNEGQPLLQRIGLILVGGVAIQLLLGFAAFAMRGAARAGTVSPTLEVTATTIHQWFGALILTVAVMLACWNFRLLQPPSS